MKKYRFIDLFAGIGGFRLGLEGNNFECVWSSELDKHCQEVYQDNFGALPFGDITKVEPAEIPDFEVLTGGFPCQPFSISGKKLGFEDTRGTLFFDICRIISEKKPKIVILENVRHFANHNNKRTLTTVLKSLENLQYNVTWDILNTKDFGLPQNRDRIFIIGTKRGIFDFSKMKTSVSKPLKHFLEPEQNQFDYLDAKEYTLLDRNQIKIQKGSGLIFCGYRNKKGFQRGVRPNSEHLNRSHRQPNRIYSIEGYHPTLPSQETSGRFFIYNESINKVRKLTVKECYRIMGFPEGFKIHPVRGTQYKQIGNSVGVTVIKEISNQIILQGLLDEKTSHEFVGLQKLIYKNYE